jgi:hypothetical protein
MLWGMSTAAVTLTKIEDHEGSGTCGQCGREGLRWVATMSDGSLVGLECAKKIIGYRPSPDSYRWVADYVATAEHAEYKQSYVLWTHRCGNGTRETCNGVLTAVGGVSKQWERKGWL